MRVLLLGPCHDGGSIPPYLAVLARGLRDLGVRVDRLGSTGLPYDTHTRTFWPADRVIAAAEKLIRNVDPHAYDLISIHFGNLEIEQLLPVLWGHRRPPPAVYHVHSLDWTLFTYHIPEPALRAAVDDGVRDMDGFVFFGRYAQHALHDRLAASDPATVAWLPTTIPPGTRSTATPRLRTAICLRPGRPLTSLYGFATPWKDSGLLLAACAQLRSPARIVLAGPYWDDPTQAGIDLRDAATTSRRHGRVDVAVVPDYLTAGGRRALAEASDLAVFPYRSHPSFQGSGAIADYLAHSVPVLATDVANMAELIGDVGLVVPPDDPAAFAEALDRIAGDAPYRDTLTKAAERRARWFTAEAHARSCLTLYEQVLDGRRATR